MRESLSSWFWGAVLPLSTMCLTVVHGGAAFLIMSLYPVLILRIYGHMRQRGFAPYDALLYASFCVLAKFPEVLGQILFHGRKCVGRPSRLIEYRLT